MSTDTPTSELISPNAMRDIAQFDVQITAGNIESYVATKFRKHYKSAMHEALSTCAERTAEATKHEAEVIKLVKADAEKRLKVKIEALKKGFQAWGATVTTEVTNTLTAQEEGEGRHVEVVYNTYSSAVTYTVHQGTDKEERQNQYDRSNGHSGTLSVELKYPAKAASLLKKRDEACEASREARAIAEDLKREESSAIATARDRVGGMLVENRLRAVDGGDQLVNCLDNLTDELIGDVDQRLQQRLELKKKK